jgi:predicted SAM-dependent methyltransferase
VKLNFGGRDKPIPGFLTVDLYDGDGVDIREDITSLSSIQYSTVEEIYASHCLEHIPHPKTLPTLKEWRRVLKPRAKAYIAVPNFHAMVRLYNQFGLTEFIRNMLYGDQGYPLAYHYTAFTFETLAPILVDAGFSDVKRIEDMPYGLKDCSQLVDSYTRTPISLNVEATA